MRVRETERKRERERENSRSSKAWAGQSALITPGLLLFFLQSLLFFALLLSRIIRLSERSLTRTYNTYTLIFIRLFTHTYTRIPMDACPLLRSSFIFFAMALALRLCLSAFIFIFLQRLQHTVLPSLPFLFDIICYSLAVSFSTFYFSSGFFFTFRSFAGSTLTLIAMMVVVSFFNSQVTLHLLCRNLSALNYIYII